MAASQPDPGRLDLTASAPGNGGVEGAGDLSSAQQPLPGAGPAGDPPAPEHTEGAPPPGQKALTIGAVCKALQQEFPDISISKIRYLEDQKLLAPRRTAGGYRLYTTADVARLRAILRLQRDEFLPLRVIRQELAAGRGVPEQASGAATAGPDSRPGAALKRATFSIRDRGASYTLQEVVDETGADPRLIKELEDFGIVSGRMQDGVRHYDDAEREIVRAVTELAQYGVAARNLRVLRTSAEREAALLQQILAPALRSRNPERRKEAVEVLENLAAVASHLKHLLLVRDLRRIVG